MTIYDNAFAQRILLVDLSPYDVIAGAITTKYVASETYNTKPSDTPANVRYLGCIRDDVQVMRSMYAGDKIGGRSIPDIAVLSVINTKEPSRTTSRFDDWLNPSKYVWQGREIVMYLIEKGAALSTREEVFRGIIDDIDYDENTIVFRIRSRHYLLDKLLQSTRYGGTGGEDGFAELEGRPKPITYGKRRNIEPVLINSVSYIYQVHDGAIQSIDEVRDRGNPDILFYADYSTYAALEAASIPAGYYATSLARGLFRLQSPPAGRITCDVRGAKINNVYSAKAGNILKDIAQNRASITSFDNAAIAVLNVQISGDIGIYYKDDVNIMDVMDGIVNSYFGFYGFNRAGQFDVGVFAPPIPSASVLLGERNIDLGTLQREMLAQVAWKVSVYYRPNSTIQTLEEFDGSVEQDMRDYYSTGWMTDAIAEDASIKTKYPNAIELVFYSNHYDQVDADSYASALLSFYGVSRSLFRAQTSLAPLEANVNDNVKITHSRYNLASGGYFRLVALEEFLLTARTNISVVG